MGISTFSKSRVTGFSDAVFSVAMTLLVLEVAIPTYTSLSQSGTTQVLLERTPNFIGFVLSFFVTAFYWIDYMRTSKYVSEFDMKALWINIFILFFVVLLPFSTAFYVNGFDLTVPFVFYSFNLSLISLMIYLFTLYISKKEKEKTGLTKLKGKLLATRSLNTFSVWFLACLFAFVLPFLARFFFVFIFIIDPIIDKYYIRKIEKQSL